MKKGDNFNYFSDMTAKVLITTVAATAAAALLAGVHISTTTLVADSASELISSTSISADANSYVNADVNIDTNTGANISAIAIPDIEMNEDTDASKSDLTISKAASSNDGWYSSGTNTYYYENGVAVKGWKRIDGLFYYFDSDGRLYGTGDNAGVHQINNLYYFFHEDGHVEIGTGWFRNPGGSWAYVEQGDLCEGWKTIDGKLYYFWAMGYLVGGNGEARTLYVDGVEYFIQGDGHVVEGPEWVQLDDRWYYIVDYTAVTGWQKIDNKWYYFYDSGSMLSYSGFTTIDNVEYYFHADGHLEQGTCWVKSSSTWYYLENGTKALGWRKINNRWYYFQDFGYSFQFGSMLYSGSFYIDDTYYYFNSDGTLVNTNSWHRDYYGWHYVYANGKEALGWFKVDGSWYYSSNEYPDHYHNTSDDYVSQYACYRNVWVVIDGHWYHFDDNCKMDQSDYSFESGFFDLTPENTSWDRCVCYYDAPGQMAHGWRKIDGTWYYFDNIVDRYYDGEFILYEQNDGRMVTGDQYIDGAWYYFNSDGSLKTGWTLAYLNGIPLWRYFTTNGALTGWQKIGNNWFYFESRTIEFLRKDGVMATGWRSIGNHWYYFSDNGIMQVGWSQIDGNWYYFSGNGIMQTGWQQINGNYYYFGGSGVMQSDTWVGNYHLNASGVWDTSR